MPNIGLRIENVYWLRDTNGVFQACVSAFGETSIARVTVKQAERLWPTLPKTNLQTLRSGIRVPIVPLWYVRHCERRLCDDAKLAPKAPVVRECVITEMNRLIWHFNDELAPSSDECDNHAMFYVPSSLLGSSPPKMDVRGVCEVLSSVRDEMLRTPAYAASLRWKALDDVRHPDDLSKLCIEHNGEMISIAPYVLATFHRFSAT